MSYVKEPRTLEAEAKIGDAKVNPHRICVLEGACFPTLLVSLEEPAVLSGYPMCHL